MPALVPINADNLQSCRCVGEALAVAGDAWNARMRLRTGDGLACVQYGPPTTVAGGHDQPVLDR